ncbi:MAG: cytochrome-c peroxidase [Rhizobiaceae bacterium]
MPTPLGKLRVLVAVLAVSLPAAGAQAQTSLAEPFSPAELHQIEALSLAKLPPRPRDPTNEVEDSPAAMALGATLFFDMRMSKNGAVACSTCHQIGRQFQDGIPLGKGVATMNRRTQPLAGVAWQRWFFWDGRKDSLWSQALGPLEKPQEHGLNRTWYAHFMANNFKQRYERIFGPMPDLSRVPANAGPFNSDENRQAWSGMSQEDRDAVDRIFVNIGKAIAAFETSIDFPETRFDRFAKALAEGREAEGDAVLSEDEIAGLKLFVGRGNCDFCHAGPRFTDDGFHNTAVPAVPTLPVDRGRRDGFVQLFADEFSCRGQFNAASPRYCPPQSEFTMTGREVERAFKTPSLRGVAARAPYMHAGQFETLERVLDHYSTAPEAESGKSEVAPLNLSSEEKAALIAFLKTLGN